MMREAIEHHHQSVRRCRAIQTACEVRKSRCGRGLSRLADAYANMVTEQSFSAAHTPEQALDELSKMSGTRFDGMLVRLLLRGLKSERTANSGI